MRIDPATRMAGIPSLEVRRLLELAARRQFVNPRLFQNRGHLSNAEATALVELLVKRQLMRLANPQPGGGGPWYSVTNKGARFVLASGAKPLRRATAERKVREFLDRIAQANSSDQFVFRVAKVLVFGSYLTDAETLNDVDLAVQLRPRWSDKDTQHKQQQERIKAAIQAGRRFGNILNEVFWPQHEVVLFLKSRSRALSLHDMDDDVLKKIPTRVLFEETQPS